MFILHLALGGCIGAPPIRFGLTSDTGGHIAYVVDAAMAQAALDSIDHVSIVTRSFRNPLLGVEFALSRQMITAKLTIDRISTAETRYLEKEALHAELPALTGAFLAHLAGMSRLPDVIHAHFADAAALAEAARARFGIPLVYTPHALGMDKQSPRCRHSTHHDRLNLEQQAIRSADAIIVSTRDEAERQISAYGIVDSVARTERLSPGVPQNALCRAETGIIASLAKWLDDPKKPIVLAIARPVRKKNLCNLVRAFAATSGLAEKANLVILAGQHGHGLRSREEQSVINELVTLCDSDRLRGRVAMPPSHSGSDVNALYRLAASGGVFVNPAQHEPFGLTLIEAAAMGVPVVATRNGGPADIIAATGHGLLVDPEDVTQIGEACLRILSDAQLHQQLSRAGRERAPLYSWPRYAERSAALYASLTRPPGLLASDIDGTLTGCRDGAQAFVSWRADTSLPFVMATGRSLSSARAVIAEWHLPQPDAFIVDVGTRIMLPDKRGFWRQCADYAAAIDRDWDRHGVTSALSPLNLAAQPAETAGPHKLSFYGSAEDAIAIRSALQNAGLQARVLFSHGCLLDVLAPHAGKAAAIAAYASRLGLSLRDCVAAGDSGNDLDMLRDCGRAIVVGNAGPELASLAVRHGLIRAHGHHAAGVLEGLAAFGLVPVGHNAVAA